MLIRLNSASIAADADALGSAALKISSATRTLASSLNSCSGMAGIDPMAEEFAEGTPEQGGYDAAADAMLRSGQTLAQAVAGFEAYVIGLAAAYRAMELAGAEGGANTFATLRATTISSSQQSAGTSLGDEQRGSPQGEIMEWIENFLKDTAGIVIPTADTGKVNNAASAWETYSSQLTSAAAGVRAALPVTLASTFPQTGAVSAVQNKLSELIAGASTDASGLAQGCREYATNVETIRDELRAMLGQLAVEVAIDIGVGVALSFFTFGAGALAAMGKAATTVARWVPKLVALVNRLRSLITVGKRTMALMRRAAVEAIESTVSGTIANAGASLAFGNFSWSGMGGAAISSGIGGVVAGPFSHVGSAATSRVTRVTTTSVVGGVTGGAGGVAGEFVASAVTGQEFNLIVAALAGTAGGTAGGALTNLRTPSVGGAPSAPSTAPSTGGGVPATGTGAPSTGGGAGAPSAGGGAGAPSTGGAPSAGGGAPAAGGGAPSTGGGAPAAAGGAGAPAAAGGGVPPAGAGTSTPGDTQIDAPASPAQDAPASTPEAEAPTSPAAESPASAPEAEAPASPTSDGSDAPASDASEPAAQNPVDELQTRMDEIEADAHAALDDVLDDVHARIDDLEVRQDEVFDQIQADLDDARAALGGDDVGSDGIPPALDADATAATPPQEGRVYDLEGGGEYRTQWSPEQLHGGTDAAAEIAPLIDASPYTAADVVRMIDAPTEALSTAELTFLTDLRRRVTSDGSTVWQKVLAPGDGPSRLDGTFAYQPDSVTGFVTRLRDVAHLATPREIYEQLRLDYAGSPFRPDGSENVQLLRFTLDAGSSQPVIPFDSIARGGPSEFTAPVPFTGNGYTAAGLPVASGQIIPESSFSRSGGPGVMDVGTEMWEITPNGIYRLVGVLLDGRGWVAVR